MPKTQYDDKILKVSTGEDISDIGVSALGSNQKLNDAILFTIKGENAHIIQFITNSFKWTAGPKIGTMKDAPGFNHPALGIKWKIDSAGKPDPYYDSKGACKRGAGYTVIGDQPDVRQQNSLLFEAGKKLIQLKRYDHNNVFFAQSFVIINDVVKYKVAWARVGIPGKEIFYNVIKIEKSQGIPEYFKNVLRADRYNMPILSGVPVDEEKI